MELGYHLEDEEEGVASDGLFDEERGQEDIDTRAVRLTMLGRDCVQFLAALWQPKNIVQNCLSYPLSFGNRRMELGSLQKLTQAFKTRIDL